MLFRPLASEDKAFFYNSWLKSFRNGSLCKGVDNTIYYINHHKVIDLCLKNSNIIVCCNSDDPKIIYGYICWERIDGQFVLHYLYVKEKYRKLGIAKMLLAQTGHDFSVLGCYTHQTKPAFSLEEKLNLVYHPYILLKV